MTLKVKLLIVLSIMLFVLTACIVAYFDIRMTKQITTQENQRYLGMADYINKTIDETITSERMGLFSMIDNTAVQAAFAARDRDTLLRLTAPIFQDAKKEGIEQIQFHTPPAIAFLRLHAPTKYGDDLSSFRSTVVACNQEVKVIQGFEEGRAGFGFRVVAPVFYQGQHIGSAEFGAGFSNALLDNWKQETNGDVFVYGLSSGVAWNSNGNNQNTLLASTTKKDIYGIDNAVFNSVVKTGTVQTTRIDGGKTAVILIPIKDYSGNVAAVIKAVTSRAVTASALKSTFYTSLAIAILGMIVELMLLYFVIGLYLRPLSSIMEGLDTLAGGDLTKEMKIDTRDETGQLAASVNKFVTKLRTIIKQVKEDAQSLAGTSMELSSGVKQTTAAANEIAAAMGDIARSVDQVASNIQTISKASDDANKYARDGNAGIARITGQMQNITTSTALVSKTVGDLNTKTLEINRILDLITDVANQTNLLALNAAIEAARAGDAGRGFAVVAEEVRKLAEQSAGATKDIGGLIQAIQVESQKAVKSMTDGEKEVGDGVNVVREVGDAFKQIIGAVQDLTSQIKDMVAATDRITSGVQNAAASTEEQTAAMEEIAPHAESLSQFADGLNSLVGKFAT